MQSDQYIETAGGWARHLEETIARATGDPLNVAREKAARLAKLPARTFLDLRYRRTKTIRAHVYEQLREAFLAETRKELAKLETEIAVAEASGLCLDQSLLAEAKAHVEQAKALLNF